MTDREILSALENIIEPVREDIHEVKEQINILNDRVERVEEGMQELNDRVERVEEGMQELNVRVRKIELTQENVVLPRLQNIEACYISTFDRYKDSVDGYEEMREDVSLLQSVVASHSEKLQKIS